MKTKENPYGVAFLALVPWIIGGTAVVTGVGLAASDEFSYKEAFKGRKQVDTDHVDRKTEHLITEIEQGRRPRTSDPLNEITVFTSVSVCPPSVKAAQYQASWWYAMAAFVDNGNSQLIAQAKKYLADARKSSGDNRDPNQIGSVLDSAANGLGQSGNVHFESIIRMLLFLASPTCIKRAKKFEEEYSASGNLQWAVGKTLGTAAAPITYPIEFIAGVFSGRAPSGIPQNMWVLIRWGIIGLTAAYVLRTAKGLVGLGEDE